MKKFFNLLFLILFVLAGTNLLNAQTTDVVEETPSHRIIYQLSTGDSLAHKQLMKQLGNIQKVAPGTMVEVVCYGPGLDMLVKEKSVVAGKVKEHADAGVAFRACEMAMKDRNVEKSQIIPGAGTVPAGVIEIVTKQEQGWSYIKAGF